MQKLLLSEVKKRSLDKGFVFIDNDYLGQNFKNKFKCLEHNEIHRATFHNISKGQGIKCCDLKQRLKHAYSMKLSLSSVKNISVSKGFKFLDKKYVNANYHHSFMCMKHQCTYKTRFANIQNGQGLRCCNIAATILRIKSGKFLTKTAPHVTVSKILDDLRVKHQPEKDILPFSVDEYCKQYKLCIEVQGDYWHCNPRVFLNGPINEVQIKNIDRDIRKKRFLLKNGYNVLCLWEKDIKNNKDYIKNKIMSKIEMIKRFRHAAE